MSDYYLPDWEETPEGFHKLMTSLSFASPPTALLVAEPPYCSAALVFLAGRGLLVPRDLSLVNIISDPVFCLHRPILARFEFNLRAHINRAIRWVEAVAEGKAVCETFICAAEVLRAFGEHWGRPSRHRIHTDPTTLAIG